MKTESARSGSSAVELIKIEKTFSLGDLEVPVLRGVDLTIRPGEFVALMGPSGSGKSTLLNLMGCLDQPSSGQLFLLGQDISKTSEEELARMRREWIGFVFQSFNLISRIPVLENVEMPLVLQGVDREIRRSKARALLASVGLEHRLEYSPLRLSGGERQRVAIARALANDPPLIIADEPTGNLDQKNTVEVMEILNQLHRDGRTIIMVTHNPEITQDCTRIIRMRDGRVVEEAS